MLQLILQRTFLRLPSWPGICLKKKIPKLDRYHSLGLEKLVQPAAEMPFSMIIELVEQLPVHSTEHL